MGRRLLGEDRVAEAAPTLGGEDFAFFGRAGVPASFAFLGARNAAAGAVHGLHTPQVRDALAEPSPCAPTPKPDAVHGLHTLQVCDCLAKPRPRGVPVTLHPIPGPVEGLHPPQVCSGRTRPVPLLPNPIPGPVEGLHTPLALLWPSLARSMPASHMESAARRRVHQGTQQSMSKCKSAGSLYVLLVDRR